MDALGAAKAVAVAGKKVRKILGALSRLGSEGRGGDGGEGWRCGGWTGGWDESVVAVDCEGIAVVRAGG